MAYTFTQEELDQIDVAFTIAETSASDQTAGKFAGVYELIRDILTVEGPVFDRPVDGLEENVWIWINGAKEINTGNGYYADFIRGYTRSQFEQRYHRTISDEDLNSASNSIARNFINDILQGTTPTIEELGLIDAAPVAGDIFNQLFDQNFTPWSGTLLFPFLGVDSYYKDWLLTEGTVGDFKPIAGTYDLISTAATVIPLASSPTEIAVNLLSTFGFSGTVNAYLNTSTLANDTDAFINQVYKLDKYGFDLELGSDIFGVGSKSANYVIGTVGSDSYNKNPNVNLAVNGTSSKDVINAGLGDDFVFAGKGDDLIDGGEGNDTLDAGDGNNLIVSGAGADDIILGMGEHVILDGAVEDRLFIRGSHLGIQQIDGADRLFPLLGGVSSFISYADFNGQKFNPDQTYYDTDGDGNVEYWFSSTLQTIVTTGGNGSIVVSGQDVLADLNPSRFALMYEMNGSDLEVKLFLGQEIISPFFEPTSGTLDPFWNFHATEIPNIQITLANYQSGDFGLQLISPLELGSVLEDNDSTVNGTAVTDHNNAVAYINNNGDLNQTLGQQVAKSPVSDSLSGQPIEIIIKLGGFDEQYVGDETDESIDGQGGDDTIEGAGGDDEIEGGFGDDTLSGGAGDDTINGGAENDTVSGGTGADTLSGGSGEDTVDYSSSSSGVSIDFEEGTGAGGEAEGDQLSEFEGVLGSNFNDSFSGSANNESFFGQAGNDTILGLAGDDILDGGEGADILNGGDGLDSASYQSSIEAVMVDLINQLASGGFATGDTLSNIEGVIGSDFSDTIIGNDLDNVLRGADGDDVIFGGDGNDIIEGGDGVDTLDGGAGIDTLDFSSSSNGVLLDLSSQNSAQTIVTTSALQAPTAPLDQYDNFENATGSNHADQLKGDSGDNVLSGLEGDDEFIATEGADIILGGFGSDTLNFSNSIEAIQVDLSTSSFAGGLANNLQALSIENIVGTDFNDQLMGSAIENNLNGGAGDDTLKGGAFDDLLDGGDGANDTAIYEGNRADYSISQNQPGRFKITDLRPDGDEGTDIIENIEFLQFADGTIAVPSLILDNASPELVDDQLAPTNEDEVVIIDPNILLANDQEFDGETLAITNLLNVRHGTAVILPSGEIEFTPDLNFNGTTTFQYEVSDGISIPSIATVTLEISPVADTPIARVDDNIVIYTNEPRLITKEELLANDINVDGTPLEIVSVTSTSAGTTELTPEGDILFTPSATGGTTSFFSYEVSNDGGQTSSFSLIVATIEDRVPLTAEDDVFDGNENQPLTINFADLFDNDVNQGTGSLNIKEITNVANGSVTIGQNQDLIFIPDQGFSGTASFDYKVDNGEGGEDTATVTINVIADPQNTAPVANDDSGFEVLEDEAILITQASLLNNDSDADNDPLQIISVSNATNGAVELTTEGNVRFTPVLNYAGPASFTYTISDGQGGEATATVSLDVTPVNDAPSNLEITNLEIEENSLGGTLVGELSISDPDQDDTVTYTIENSEVSDLFEVEGNRILVKEGAQLDFETQNTFDLTVSATDQGGLTVQNSFTIQLTDVLEDATITGTSGNDTLTGSSSDDRIDGLGGNDTLLGNAGNDVLIGGAGGDILNGGDGNDTADYSGSQSKVIIFLSNTWWRPYGVGFGGDANGDKLIDIENVIGSNFNDVLIGDSQDNVFEGQAGNDYLIGGRGEDTFIFKEGDGRDTVLDFNTSNSDMDKIIIEMDGVDSFEDLSGHISSVGFFSSSTRIEFTSGDRLTLLGVRNNELTEDHFEFL